MALTASILLLGSFDGVHLGHQSLLHHACELARTHDEALGASAPTRVIALAFDPSPRAILRPGTQPLRLTSFPHRVELLMRHGAHEVVQIYPHPDLLHQEPEAFIAELCARYNPVAFVEGEDFRFGHSRRGDIHMLRTLGAAHGFTVQTVPPVEAAGLDQQIVEVSSTRIRALLAAGRAADANILLGRPYQLRGAVTQGNRLGRTIDFPTANLTPEHGEQGENGQHESATPLQAVCLPADGVYACIATLPDGTRLPAAANIGTRPTVGGVNRTIEAHLIGARRQPGQANLSGLPEYGWRLKLDFVAFVREQVKFAGLDALRGQLTRDVAHTLCALAAAEAAGDLARDGGAISVHGQRHHSV